MMPVRITVKRILDERGLNISQFAAKTGLSYPTALSWYHNHAMRIELETLAAVIEGLGVELTDVLEHTKENKNPAPR